MNSLQRRHEASLRRLEAGAREVDVVIARNHVLTGDWRALYDEVRQFREACGSAAHMKTILGTGDLGTLKQVYQASLVAMMAGSDFVKTSTGKEPVNATLEASLVMVRAIREYLERTGYKVGFKPAGGISSAKQTMAWQALMKEELGDEWLMPDLFRIGASTLPNAQDRAVFVIGQQHFVAWLKPKRVGDEVHADGRVFHKDQVFRRGGDELPQLDSRRVPRRLELPHEEVHRLLIEPLDPLQPCLADHIRRRTERAVVQINGVRAKLPMAAPAGPIGGKIGRHSE